MNQQERYFALKAKKLEYVWGESIDDQESYFVGTREPGEQLFKLCICVDEETAQEIATALLAQDLGNDYDYTSSPTREDGADN